MTRWTVWPLMSMPRMSLARAAASSGLCASFTPPALPRPPVLTWALMTTVPPPSRSAPARASSGVSATAASSTGTPCSANRSRAWYSNRSTVPRPRLPVRLCWLSSVVLEAHRRRTSGAAASLVPGQVRPATECRVKGTGARLVRLTGGDVLADPLDDGRRRGARSEDLGDPELLQFGDVRVRDDPASEH